MTEEIGSSGDLSPDRVRLLAGLRDARELPAPHPPAGEPQPLSFAQERMWLIDRLEPGTSLYNANSAWRLRGPVHAEVLRAAVADVLSRHDSLRVRITESDTHLEQQVVAVETPFEHVDFSHREQADADEAARDFIRTCADRPFDLSRPPFLRAALATINATESLFLIVVHHIATDGWSMGVLARDLSSAYRARLDNHAPDWPPLPATYLDYAVQQRRRLRGANLQRLIDYWKAHLEGLEPVTLPCDHDRPGHNLHPAGEVSFDLSPDATDAIRKLARSAGVTDYMTLLATLHVLLFRLGAAPDHAIGSPVAGRLQLEHENIVGFFVNTLVMRTRLESGMTFREVLVNTRSSVLDAIDHQALPFEKLVIELNPVREPGRNPLFQVGFAFQNTPTHGLELPGAEAERVPTGSSLAKFDLHFSIVPNDRDMRGTLYYSADLFSGSTAGHVVRCFVKLLSSICSTPDQPIGRLEILDAGQARQIREDWSGQRTDYPREATLDRLFHAQAAARAGSVCLEEADQRITYAALGRRAQALCDTLRRAGIARGARVGILLHRSADMVAGMIAALEAGAAWVPLDPAFPRERLEFIARDAGISALLTNAALRRQAEGLSAVVIDAESVDDFAPREGGTPGDSRHDASDVAAIFYTSGSTGTPRGVAVTHRNIIRLVHGQDYVPFSPALRFLLHSPASFDASTFELWGALLHGAVCVIAPADVVEVPSLRRTLVEHRIDVLWLTASLFNLVVDEQPDALAGVRWILTGGEALSVPHVRRAQQCLPDATLINGYGPTETTTFACCHIIPRDLPANCRSIPIGRPLANTFCYVVDCNDQLCAPGVEGELLIGGDGVAAGYLNPTENGVERFVTHEASEGVRVYRTGDRVRWLHDGTLEFRGRMDDQIKLRGFRIEPGEIAAVLLENPEVGQATVVVREDQPGARHLVAYATGRKLDPETELDRLRRRLPAYMIPSALVVVDSLPLTANGKIDRKALPPPDRTAAMQPDAQKPVQPRNHAERLLVNIWSELFERTDIGIHDNFFALGGHSLLASRACLRIGRQFGIDVPMSVLFARPTVAQLAGQLSSLGPSRALVMQNSTTVAVVRPSLHGDYVLCVGGRIADLLQTLPNDIGILFLGSGEGDPVAFHRRGIDGAVSAYAAEIAKINPVRKLVVTGFSYGGLVAYALATHLRQRPGLMVDAVLLEPSIRTGPAWEPPAPVKRLTRYGARILKEGPKVIWRSMQARIQSARQEEHASVPERTFTEGERAWLLVGPHMRRNVRRYRPRPSSSDGIHLVFGTDWMRTHYPVFKALCTARPAAHPVGQIGHHDMVDDPRCIAVWRDLINRLFC